MRQQEINPKIRFSLASLCRKTAISSQSQAKAQ
jgi:hypothetical protein